tara:strand:- start:1043 stop:1315 length:273 start_codon:yes stop_codon:yes gene_type:complete
METKNKHFELDVSEIIKRSIKYLLEGAAVGIAARYIPSGKIDIKEISMIAFTAACVFAILDLYAPSISMSARQGAGFAIGASTLGGLKTI